MESLRWLSLFTQTEEKPWDVALSLHIERLCLDVQLSQSDHTEICHFGVFLWSCVSHFWLTARPNGVKLMAALCCSQLSALHFQFVLYCHHVLSSALPLTFLLLHPFSISLSLFRKPPLALVFYYSINIRSETAFDVSSRDSSFACAEHLKETVVWIFFLQSSRGHWTQDGITTEKLALNFHLSLFSCVCMFGIWNEAKH